MSAAGLIMLRNNSLVQFLFIFHLYDDEAQFSLHKFLRGFIFYIYVCLLSVNYKKQLLEYIQINYRPKIKRLR